MKKRNYATVLVLFLAMTVCVNCQPRKTVTGNKKVISRERSAGEFTGVSTSTAIDVVLSQGEKNAITVEADENLHEYILTEVRNGTLYIFTEVNIKDAEMRRVHVTMKDITSVSSTSAGDVIGITPIKTGDLKISASSAGDIKLEVYAKNIDLNGSSAGDITLSGEADFLEASLSSAGDLNAFNLQVREADVSASSSGDADVFVTQKLRARSSSAGDINYKGNPENIDAHSSSAGSINRR
jgi:hypothetical protein